MSNYNNKKSMSLMYKFSIRCSKYNTTQQLWIFAATELKWATFRIRSGAKMSHALLEALDFAPQQL